MTTFPVVSYASPDSTVTQRQDDCSVQILKFDAFDSYLLLPLVLLMWVKKDIAVYAHTIQVAGEQVAV